MPVDHYENFPVASWLLPARLREPIEAIYAFARGADDLADEGDAPESERLRGLERYGQALDAIEAGLAPEDPVFARLARAIRAHALPVCLFRDLLDAFRQDVTVRRYARFEDLLDYSRRSANPVGRLVLHLAQGWGGDAAAAASEAARAQCAMSDLVCSGLQFANFWQDVAADWRKGRVYLPQEDLTRFGVTERDIEDARTGERWRALMRFQCDRTRSLLRDGAPLGRMLRGRIGIEIRATVQGGLAVLDRIDAVHGDVFRHRPKLGKLDWAKILVKAL